MHGKVGERWQNTFEQYIHLFNKTPLCFTLVT